MSTCVLCKKKSWQNTAAHYFIMRDYMYAQLPDQHKTTSERPVKSLRICSDHFDGKDVIRRGERFTLAPRAMPSFTSISYDVGVEHNDAMRMTLARSGLAPSASTPTVASRQIVMSTPCESTVSVELVPPEIALRPVLKLYDIMIDYGTPESYVIEEEKIKSEPVDTDTIENKIENGFLPGKEGTQLTVIHPRNSNIISDEQPTDLHVIEETDVTSEYVDVDWMKKNADHNSSCRAAGDAFSDECSVLHASTSTKKPRRSIRRYSTEKNYKYSKFTYMSDRNYNLKWFMKGSSDEKKHHCMFCDYKPSLHTAYMGKHTSKTFNCEHCDYKSDFKHDLLTHTRKHTGETFNCEHCDYKSISKCSFLAHTRKHTGETFNCEHCNYKSGRKYYLIQHMRKHTGKTFNCEHCDYKSTSRNHLLAHMRTHTGETFNCEQCGYKAHFKHNLLIHMRKHTGETFNCEHCDYKTIDKSSLFRHVRRLKHSTLIISGTSQTICMPMLKGSRVKQS